MIFMVQKQGYFARPNQWHDCQSFDCREDAQSYIDDMRDCHDEDYDGRYLSWRIVEQPDQCERCGGEGEYDEALPYYGATNAYMATKPCPDCREAA